MPNPFTIDFLLSLGVTIGLISDTIVVQEPQGLIHVPMYRYGNITTKSIVKCVVHTGTANSSDFVILQRLVVFPINSTQAGQCMYMYVCIYLCMYLCTSQYMYVSMYLHVCMYECMNVCMYICMYVCMYVCMYMYLFMYVSMYITVHVCIYVSTCMYV